MDSKDLKTDSNSDKGGVKRKKKKEDDKSKWILRLIILILLVLLAFITLRSCQFNIQPSKQPELPRPGVGVVQDGDLPSMSKNGIEDYLKKKQDASRFTMKAVSEATIKQGSKTLNLLVSNPEVNSIDCYVEILYKNEVIYTSPIMKPKQFIKTAELNKELPLGKNTVIVRYYGVYQGNIISVSEVQIYATCK